MASNRGILVVISGPSGVGKGTVRKKLFEKYGDKLFFSISMTTREKRKGEEEGRDYYYVTREEFDRQANIGNFLEHAVFVENCYGTPKDKVEEKLDAGFDVVLEIDVVGAMQVKEKMPDCVSIFIVPPSLEVLEERLRNRNTETEETIKKRLKKASGELEFSKKYDYVVVNDDIERAAGEIADIIKKEHDNR